MNEQFKPSFNTTVKPSDTKYSNLTFFTILIILLLVCIHLYRYGIHMDIKVPSNSDAIIAKKKIPNEAARKIKEHLTEVNEDPTTM